MLVNKAFRSDRTYMLFLAEARRRLVCWWLFVDTSRTRRWRATLRVSSIYIDMIYSDIYTFLVCVCADFIVDAPPDDSVTSLHFSPKSSNHLLVSSWDSVSVLHSKDYMSIPFL